jgi:2-aminoadipate transaminase
MEVCIMDANTLFSRTAKAAKASEIREILKVIKSKSIISFAGGMPDPALFPVEEIKVIISDVLTNRAKEALQYETTEGYDPLRLKLFNFMKGEGMLISSKEEVMVTTGSQQALDLFARTFIDPGDAIILEEPTYLAAWSAFKPLSPEVILAPMDEKGLNTSILGKKLKSRRGERKIKFLYTVPTCQNPTGLTMSEDRRRELVELAEEHDFLIVEDDPYSYLTDEKNPLFIKALNGDRTIYTSTFSKILAPGLRLGWVTAPKEILNKLAVLKQSLDLCTCTLSQHIAYEFMERGLLEGYIARLKPAYKEKREVMYRALENYFPKDAKWTKPNGGMFFWVTLPKGIDTKLMLDRAIMRDVAYVPGSPFYPSGGGKNTMRLNYSYATPAQIEEGIKRLGEVIRETLK